MAVRKFSSSKFDVIWLFGVWLLVGFFGLWIYARRYPDSRGPVFSFRELDNIHDLLGLIEGLVSFNVCFWLLSLVLGKSWPSDFIWMTWPLLQMIYLTMSTCPMNSTWGWTTILPHCSGTWGWQATLQLALTFLWGARLFVNFVDRGGVRHEKSRYTEMRKNFGAAYGVISFFTVFAAQTTMMFVGCLPMFTIVRSTLISPGHSICGAIICFFGIMIEHNADLEMDAFVKLRTWKRKQKMENKEVLDTGLWGWSRHPNYCGQLMFWWGTWFASIQQGEEHFNYPRSTYFAHVHFKKFGVFVFAPALVSIYFHVIADHMDGTQLENKKDEYKEYMLRVTSPIMIFPPSAYKPWLKICDCSRKLDDRTKKEKIK